MPHLDLTPFHEWLLTQRIRPTLDEADLAEVEPEGLEASGRPMTPTWAKILVHTLEDGQAHGYDLQSPRLIIDWIRMEKAALRERTKAAGRLGGKGRTKHRTIQTAYGYLNRWQPDVFPPLPPLKEEAAGPPPLNPNKAELAAFYLLYDVLNARCRLNHYMVARLRWQEIRYNDEKKLWEIRQSRGEHALHPIDDEMRVALALLREWSPPRKPRYPIIPMMPGSAVPLGAVRLRQLRERVLYWIKVRKLPPDAIEGYFEGRVRLRLRTSPRWATDPKAGPEDRRATPVVTPPPAPPPFKAGDLTSPAVIPPSPCTVADGEEEHPASTDPFVTCNGTMESIMEALRRQKEASDAVEAAIELASLQAVEKGEE